MVHPRRLLLSLILGSMLLLLAACPKQEVVTAENAPQDPIAVALSQGAALIDVRTPKEFASGHLPGAINLPSGAAVDVNAFPQDTPIVLYCKSGRRATGVLKKLEAAGRNDVYNMGGVDDGERYGLTPKK